MSKKKQFVALFYRSQLLSGIHLLWCGIPSMGYRWICAPLWTSMDCRGTTYLSMVFSMRCKGRLFAPASRAPPPPSFFTDLGVCRVLSHVLTSLSLLPFYHSFFSSPSYICYHRGTTTIADGLSHGQKQVSLGAGWHWLYQTQRKLPAASHWKPPP